MVRGAIVNATEARARDRLRLAYGLDEVRQDPDGTWWVGSDMRPDLGNFGSLVEAVDYYGSLPQHMIDSLARPRGEDSER
jgi:hypothetical protein